MSHYLFSGMVLGLSAGLAPGPLMTLVISETLAHGRNQGFRVASAPLITDLPIVLLALFFLSKLSAFNMILGGLSLVGSAVILKMGAGHFFLGDIQAKETSPAPRSLAKGVVVNFLSPHPYLFWLTVGGPMTTRAWEHSLWAALGFICLFYLMLIGAKLGLALMASGSGKWLKGRVFLYAMRALGGLLCVLGLMLAWDGIRLMGLI